MRDVKQDGDAVPTVQVNGEEVHILNGDGDVKDLRLISNGVNAEPGEIVQNGDKRSHSLGEYDKSGHGAHGDSNRLAGSETQKANADKSIPSDMSDSISNESLDTHAKTTAYDSSKEHEAETPLLKDNVDTQIDNSETRFKFVVETKDSVANFKTTNSDKQIAENDNQNKDRHTRQEQKGKVLRKSISRTQSCLDDPPDGGWGWVVTFSAFMVGLILDGISFSFGLFFKELYVYFNESKSVTSWIISVLNGTYLGIGKSVNGLDSR